VQTSEACGVRVPVHYLSVALPVVAVTLLCLESLSRFSGAGVTGDAEWWGLGHVAYGRWSGLP
jgi:hypothetical protein